MPRKKSKKVSDNATGLAHGAKAVRDLLSRYTNQRDMKEGRVGLLLYGYLVAKLGTANVRREHIVDTTNVGGGSGRKEQIDFVIGRKSQVTGEFAVNTAIEFAVRREGDPHGASVSRNTSEIKKLVRADAKRRILLLMDLTTADVGKKIVDAFADRGYAKGRPRGTSSDRIIVLYVGEHLSRRVKLMRQTLKEKP